MEFKITFKTAPIIDDFKKPLLSLLAEYSFATKEPQVKNKVPINSGGTYLHAS